MTAMEAHPGAVAKPPRAPFVAKAARSEWQMVYDTLLAHVDWGDVVTYEDLERVLGRPFRPARGPLYRARRELGDLRQRWLEAVPNVGYRVLEANEHPRVAGGHKRRAKRQLGQMVHVMQVTDLTRLTAAELATHDAQAKINTMLFMVAVHHEQRLNRHEDALRRAGLL